MKVGGSETLNVPTGGQPDVAVSSVTAQLVEAGGAYRASVGHDAGCPCLSGRPLRRCTCEMLRVTWRRLG